MNVYPHADSSDETTLDPHSGVSSTAGTGPGFGGGGEPPASTSLPTNPVEAKKPSPVARTPIAGREEESLQLEHFRVLT